MGFFVNERGMLGHPSPGVGPFSSMHSKSISLTLEKTKKQALYLGYFLYFHKGILCNFHGHGQYFSIFTLFLNFFLMRKAVGSKWVVYMPFRWHV